MLPPSLLVPVWPWTSSPRCSPLRQIGRFVLQVMKQFKTDTDINGRTILLRHFSRSDDDGDRWLPVIPIEDLREFFQTHLEQATSFGGPSSLFTHVSCWPAAAVVVVMAAVVATKKAA
jgi:hypothetical protein